MPAAQRAVPPRSPAVTMAFIQQREALQAQRQGYLNLAANYEQQGSRGQSWVNLYNRLAAGIDAQLATQVSSPVARPVAARPRPVAAAPVAAPAAAAPAPVAPVAPVAVTDPVSQIQPVVQQAQERADVALEQPYKPPAGVALTEEEQRRQKLANIAFLQRTANLLTGYSGSAPKPSQLGGRQLLGI
jgi:hypothetical protein